jgi:hypothetical protein
MLQNYKEEVDTLNEALKIAAMDIAEVAEAEDDFFSDEDESEVASATAATEDPKLGSERDSSRNKDTLYKLAMSEGSSSQHKGATFIVHTDGTFEHK